MKEVAKNERMGLIAIIDNGFGSLGKNNTPPQSSDTNFMVSEMGRE